LSKLTPVVGSTYLAVSLPSTLSLTSFSIVNDSGIAFGATLALSRNLVV